MYLPSLERESMFFWLTSLGPLQRSLSISTKVDPQITQWSKNWPQHVSNRGTRSTSVRNNAFLLAIIAMPMDSAYSMHNAYSHVLSAHAFTNW